jgi:predicted AlkP superfamily pyrophosphatase or phosphodiesterase
MICIDALDYDLVREFNIFNNLSGIKTVVSNELSDNGIGISSPEAWSCIYTGKTVSKFYEDNIENTKTKHGGVYYYNDKTFWTDISDLGYKIGILESYCSGISSVPKKDGNFILTGHQFDIEIYPDILKDIIPINKISSTIPFPVSYKLLIGKDIDWEDVSEDELEKNMIDYYFAMDSFIKIRNSYLIPSIKYLNNRYSPDFLMTYRYEIDHLSHMQFHEKSKNTIKNGYKNMEDYVYELINILNPENVIIVSDHGMKNCEKRNETKVINGLNIEIAREGNGIIMSSEHSGHGFLMLCGGDLEYCSKKSKIEIQDIYDIVINLYKKQIE